MITQPYKNLLLDMSRNEAAPAMLMGDANAVQLTAVVEVANTAAAIWLECSNDAENWRLIGATTELGLDPGLYVMPAVTGICTQYVRVACSVPDAASVLLAVTQRTMIL